MRFVHECIPCGTAWTVPVRKCPYCGKDSTPFRIEVLSPSDVASAVVTNLRDDVIEECIAECNSAATDKAAYTGAERAGFHMAAFRLRALKNAAPQPSTAALAPGLSHESLGQGDVAVAASNTRSAIVTNVEEKQ